MTNTDYAYASYEHGKLKDEKEVKHYLDLYDDSVDNTNSEKIYQIVNEKKNSN